tara:strand:+ start:126 stop:479 length:354 start_codon:yes stop_codon:yes gene_type:complete
MVEFNQFQIECTKTANPNIDWGEANLNWALGIAGESGEYCELIKKLQFHGKGLNIEAAKKELGDILYYIAMAAHNLDIELDDIAQTNIDKLRARYPDGFKEGGGIRHVNNDHEDDGC